MSSKAVCGTSEMQAHRLAMREGQESASMALPAQRRGTNSVARPMPAREQSAAGHACQQQRAALCKATSV